MKAPASCDGVVDIFLMWVVTFSICGTVIHTATKMQKQATENAHTALILSSVHKKTYSLLSKDMVLMSFLQCYIFKENRWIISHTKWLVTRSTSVSSNNALQMTSYNLSYSSYHLNHVCFGVFHIYLFAANADAYDNCQHLALLVW